jgi:transposase
MGKASPAERAAVVRYALRGCTKAHTIRQLKLSKAVVDRWWTGADGSAPCLEDSPRPGRPRLLDSTEAKAIKRALKGGATLTLVKKRRAQQGKLPVSMHTIQRAAARGRQPLAYQMERAVRVLSDANKKARYDWTGAFDPSSTTPWVFLDGKVVTVYQGRRGNVTMRWAPVGKPPARAKGKLLAYLYFYAAVAKGWRSKLYFVPPSPHVGSGKAKGDRAFESTDYERFMAGLDRELQRHFQGKLFSIIRDRASQHIKAEKHAVLSALNLPIVVDYPAQSWDINCIEHVWAQLVNQIRGHRAITADGLRRVVCAGWRAIEQSTIDRLVENVPNRIRRINESKGEWIGAYSEVFPK